MNNPESNELIIKALRGELSDAEKARLEQQCQADAEFRERFTEEQRLTRLLQRLPDAPMPSNFTSLVLQAALRDRAKPQSIQLPWWRIGWRRVTAVVAGTAALATFLVVQRNQQIERTQMAESLGAFTEVASVMGSGATSAEVLLQDFEAIRKLSLPADSELDLELMVAMQK